MLTRSQQYRVNYNSSLISVGNNLFLTNTKVKFFHCVLHSNSLFLSISSLLRRNYHSTNYSGFRNILLNSTYSRNNFNSSFLNYYNIVNFSSTSRNLQNLSKKKMADNNNNTNIPTNEESNAASSPATFIGPDGQPISKNQMKKLMKGKGGPKTEEDKPAPVKKEKPAEAPAPAKKKVVERYDYENPTPVGEKKDTTTEMLPEYHPQVVEAAWDAWWNKAGYYSCDPKLATNAGENNRFVMVIPPPNVTGSLHIGHALTSAIEDTITRWHRMNGRPTMWLPGTDHAGIATQTVVEKRLKKEKGVSRHDLGRDAFVQEVWKWKEMYGNRITTQLRHLGVSTDWSRERFTMDSHLSAAVLEAFVRLHEQGLIYRENRLVNWCCNLRSAISDIEVDYIELEKRTKLAVPGHNPDMKYEFGCITSFAYKVAKEDGTASDEEIVVATTRPETMLGDTAVAVHPDDARYKHLHGKLLVHPFSNRLIPIITDGELVDMAFGTGAVKVTPAHDPNDFICGKKHNLPFITVFTEEGKINDVGGAEFSGMMRFDARYAITKALDEKKLLRGKADNKMRLGVCSRTGDVIEPLMKPQWYVKCDTMAKRAADAVRNGELTILPEMHRSTWFRWMDNIKDWCISRQLWWGHRIPAYYIIIEGKPHGDNLDSNNWVVARSESAAKAIAAARFNVPESSITLRQDEDVLDTWFSSGLFPFSTFGWPNEANPDFNAFYPNSILETGHDILFFWVARMVMMGTQLTGKLPFKTVYLHAMVRDKYGKKMSKSSGNVIDPMEVIYGCDLESLHNKVREGNLPQKEVDSAIKAQKLDFPDGIPECGADALRFGLLAYTIQGIDINLDISRVVGYRQFCNKLWNATRFALTHLAADRYTPKPLLDSIDEILTSKQLATRDRWILSRLNNTISIVDESMKNYAFAPAATAIYEFFLYELCDYYLELLKPLMAGDESIAKDAAHEAGGDIATAQRLSRAILHLCFEYGLRLLHPMMPFVTEELWQRLPGRGKPLRAGDNAPADWPSIMISPYPSTPLANATRPDIESNFILFQSVIKSIRTLRAEYLIPPSKQVTLYITVTDPAMKEIIERQACDIRALIRTNKLVIVNATNLVEDGCSTQLVNEHVTVNLLLKGLINPEDEIKKLTNKADKARKEIDRLKRVISAPNYEEKVPEDVRKQNSDSLTSNNKEIEVIEELINKYKSWISSSSSTTTE